MGMSRERALESFVKKLAVVLPETELLDFRSMSETCRVRHLACGSDYEFTPNTLRDRKGCPICSSSSKARTHEEMSRKIQYLTDGQYQLLDEPQWNSAAQIVRFQHSCGNIFESSSRSMLNAINEGRLPCRRCSGQERMTSERFARALQEAGSYVLLEEVAGNKPPVLVRHEVCGHEWRVSPNNFMNRRTRCPKCYNSRRDSKGAKATAAALQRLGLPFLEEVKLLRNPDSGRFLPLDFYIPSLAAAVEYDGPQHDRDGKPFPGRAFKAIQALDQLKERLCAKNNIHLLRLHHSVGWKEDVLEALLRRFFAEVQMCDDMVISSEATRDEWNVQRLSKARPLGGSE